MEYRANGKAFALRREIRDNPRNRLGFDALALQTFGLSFEQWYQGGFWTEKYQPYALFDGDRMASNASANVMDTVWEGAPKRYIQLGTVMTAPEYRQMGLSSFLIRRIIADWQNHCDAFYLYANDSVLGFYPKFGFVAADEYQATIPATPRDGAVRKLNMENSADIATLHRVYQKSNPFSQLPMLDNWGLLMFYCTGPMKHCLYYAEELDAVVLVEREGDAVTLLDIFCDGDVSLEDVAGLAVKGTDGKQVRLGFGLKCGWAAERSLFHEEDSTLFVLDGKENLFQCNQTMFPLLSHA